MSGLRYQQQYGASRSLIIYPQFAGRHLSFKLIGNNPCRICVLNAFLSQGNGQYGQAVGLYKRALAVLDWGRKTWSKASRKERGAIFDSTFVRGVRTMYATALVHVCFHTFPWPFCFHLDSVTDSLCVSSGIRAN